MRRIYATLLVAVLLIQVLCLPVSAVGTFREGTQKRESQLDTGYNVVGYTDEWEIYVQGHTVVAEGLGGLPYQFLFSDMKTGEQLQSTLVTGAFPVERDAYRFYKDWGNAVEFMTQTLYDQFGDRVNFVSHDTIPKVDGSCYIFYFELWNEDGKLIPVTMAWRFKASYYLFSMGVNMGDMPEIFQVTKGTAANFADYTKIPGVGAERLIYTGKYDGKLPPWDYPVLNPFWALYEYL